MDGNLCSELALLDSSARLAGHTNPQWAEYRDPCASRGEDYQSGKQEESGRRLKSRWGNYLTDGREKSKPRSLSECELREGRVGREGGHNRVVVILSGLRVAQGTNAHS